MIQNFFVLTAAQRISAMALNNSNGGINPRLIDSTAPGSGININELAVGFDVGDPITLTDAKYVAPYRMVNDPDLLVNNPDLVNYLFDLPAAALEIETIFLPPDDDLRADLETE
jgi:hypothetical protein